MRRIRRAVSGAHTPSRTNPTVERRVASTPRKARPARVLPIAALGTAIGNTLAGLAFLGVLATRRSTVGFVRDGVWAPDTARRILRIGLPQLLDRNLYALGDIPLNAILLAFGTEANAAFQIGRRVQQYARMPSQGGAIASSTLVGNTLGEHHPQEGDRYGRGSLALTVVVSGTAA